MGGTTKHLRENALVVAREITAALTPLCERLIFAGSLRRRKELVGDIEVLYVPKIEDRPDPTDLLGNIVPTNLVDGQLGEWLRAGVYAKRLKENRSPTWGELNKLAVHLPSGIGVDFFQATERNWWSLLVCRTGSAESNTRICNAAIERGLRWDPYQGFFDRKTGVLLHVPQTERGVFEHVRLPYREPWER